MRHSQRKRGVTDRSNLRSTAPALDPTDLGKSRLFYEFKLLSVSGCLVLEAYSVSHGKATAYLPVIELLKSYFRIESQDDERTRREKVGGKVLMLIFRSF